MNDESRLRELLDGLGFTAWLDNERLQKLSEVFTKEHFSQGDVIIRKDEMGDSFFLLSKGRATVLGENVNDEIIEIHSIGEGEFFGEISMITGGIRTAWVVAAEDVEAYMIQKTNLDTYLMSIPQIADMILGIAKNRLMSSQQ